MLGNGILREPVEARPREGFAPNVVGERGARFTAWCTGKAFRDGWVYGAEVGGDATLPSSAALITRTSKSFRHCEPWRSLIGFTSSDSTPIDEPILPAPPARPDLI